MMPSSPTSSAKVGLQRECILSTTFSMRFTPSWLSTAPRVRVFGLNATVPILEQRFYGRGLRAFGIQDASFGYNPGVASLRVFCKRPFDAVRQATKEHIVP